MFIRTVNGTLFPASSVTRIDRGPWKDNGHSSERENGRVFVNGQSVETVKDDEIEVLLRSMRPVVPALPGYSVLEFYHEGGADEEPWISEMDVLAWRIDEEDVARPIVADPTFDGLTGVHAIRNPAGHVTDLFGSWFETIAGWREGQLAMSVKERALESTPDQDQSPQT